MANRRKQKKMATSVFKGVSRWGRLKRWIAQIQVNGLPKRIGSFDSEIDAAIAYDAEAKKAWGDYAFLNFP